MKFVSRIMIFVIMVTSCFCNLNILAQEETVENAENAKENVVISEKFTSNLEFLKSIGAVENLNFDISDPTRKITRGELLDFSMKVSKTPISTIYNSSFVDIPNDYFGKDSIYTAVSLGYISGVDPIHFAPDAVATAGQAVKTYMNILGYKFIAEDKGGYPIGYATVANDEKVYSSNMDAELNMEILLDMTVNSLEAKMLIANQFGHIVSYPDNSGKTLLSERYHIYKGKGQIMANDYNSLSNANLKVADNNVKIGNDLFEVGETEIADYVGYIVKYYYHKIQNEDDKTIVHFEIDNSKIDEIELKYSDIANYSNGTLKYGEKTLESITIDPTANVILNGKTNNNITVADGKFIMPNSKLKFLDTDKDSKYDIIYLDVYVTYLVSKVDKENLTIVDSYGKDYLSFDDISYKYKVLNQGKVVEFSSIAANDIVSVQGDVLTADGTRIDMEKSTYFVLNIVKNKVSGKVLEVVTADDVTEVNLNDKTYTISSEYFDLMKEQPTKYKAIESGVDGTFYLDVLGQIVGYAQSGEKTVNYGFVTQMEKKEGIADDVKIKAFLMDGGSGSFYILNTTKKVKFNGNLIPSVKLFEQSEFYDKINKRLIKQLITFEVNDDGHIREITTATDHSKDANYIGYDLKNFSLDKTYKGEKYRYGKMFGQRYLLDGNTKVFIVPEDLYGENISDKDFVVTGKSMFTSDSSYSFDIYDADDSAKAGILLIKQSTEGITEMAKRPISVVEKITKGIGAEGEECLFIYFYERGKKVTVKALPEDELIDTNKTWRPGGPDGIVEDIKLTDLKRGDVIQYSTNSAGNISSFRCVFRLSEVTQIPYYQVTGEKNGEQLGTDMGKVYTSLYLGYGEVIEATSSGILFNAQDTSNSAYNIFMEYSGAKCGIYSTKTGKITPSTTNNIKKGDKILVRIFAIEPQDFLIIESK